MRVHAFAARNRADGDEIFPPFVEAILDVLERLFASLRDVHGTDKPQPFWVHRAAVLGGSIVRHFPVDAECVVAAGLRCRHAEHAEAMAPGEFAARRCDAGGHRDLRMWPGVGPQLAGRVH